MAKLLPGCSAPHPVQVISRIKGDTPMASASRAVLRWLRPSSVAGLALIVTLAGAWSATPPLPAKKPDFTTEPDIGLLYAASKTAKASELAPGVGYRLIELADFGLKIHVWSFDKSRYRLRAADKKDPHGSYVDELLGAKDVLAINGGFFERDKQKVVKASGLLIVDGRELAPERDKAGSGIVYATARSVFIGYRKDLADYSAMKSAVQVGPVLVDAGGKVGVANKQRDRQNRSAICLRPDTFVVIAVEGGLSLFQLASLLAAPAPDGIGCDSALNLDGGPSTQALFRSGGHRVAVEGGWPVANALIVSPAASSP
jgi:uncharacterized protein YigE (DUF2233 family)